MKILIINFNNYQELDKVMNKFIENNQCYLFNIICGGTSYNIPRPSVSEEWGSRNGAPIYWIINEDLNKLTYILSKEVDFIIVKKENLSPYWKTFVMKHRQEGKHGIIIP